MIPLNTGSIGITNITGIASDGTHLHIADQAINGGQIFGVRGVKLPTETGGPTGVEHLVGGGGLFHTTTSPTTTNVATIVKINVVELL